jgi:hypothetical protein
MLRGGVKRGASVLIDLNTSTVSPEAIRLLLNTIRANFVNQGGSSIIIPTTTLSSESAAESLKPLIGSSKLEERVRIAEYNKDLANIRDSGSLSIGIASQLTKVREEFLRIADYHLKMQNVSNSLVIYGVKPFTNLHGLSFVFERGYPSLSLVEIV